MLNFASLNVVDLLLDALCIVDSNSRILFVSPAFERIFGYTPEEAVGLRMLDLVHPDDLAHTQEQARDIMQGELQLAFENRYIRKDGRIAHIRWTARKAQGSDVRVALAHDITERKAMESVQAALYAISEAAHATSELPVLFTRVHRIVGDLLASQDLSVVLLDRASGQLSHAYPVDPSNATLCDLDDDALCARVLRSGDTVLEHFGEASEQAPPNPGEQAQDDSCVPVRYWLGVPLPGAHGPIGVLVLRGESVDWEYTQHDKALLQFVSTQVASAIEATQLRARLIHTSQFDPLTSLPNRLLLRDRLAGALARAKRGGSGVSLLFVDLDHFKQVNDTLGHAAGDALLQQVAQRLTSCLRGTDTVARIGGDEFVVLIEGSPANEHAPQAVQTKIAAAFGLPFFLGEPANSVNVQASVGLARFPEDGLDQDALLRRADASMYAAKQARQHQKQIEHNRLQCVLESRTMVDSSEAPELKKVVKQ